MNLARFTELLQQLGEDDWRALHHGEALLMVDDSHLQTGDRDQPNVIVNPDAFSAANADELKQQVMQQAGALLDQYYLTHPLTQQGFNQQVKELAAQSGYEAFSATPGKRPVRTLFVDGGEVVAEAPDSPRHPYGVYLQLERALEAEALQDAFNKWLESGEAYQRYLNMNVCRYNC